MRTYTLVCDAVGCIKTVKQNPVGQMPEGWQEWREVTSPSKYRPDVQLCPNHRIEVKEVP